MILTTNMKTSLTRVVVTGLYTEENTHNFKLEKPVQSIAIDPIYARHSHSTFYEMSKKSGPFFIFHTMSNEHTMKNWKVLWSDHNQFLLELGFEYGSLYTIQVFKIRIRNCFFSGGPDPIDHFLRKYRRNWSYRVSRKSHLYSKLL